MSPIMCCRFMIRTLLIFAVVTIPIISTPALAGLHPEEIRQIALIERLEQVYQHAPRAITAHGEKLWAAAALAGHTRVLAWLQGHGIPGSDVASPEGFNLWFIAAIEGHVHVLEWLQYNKIADRDVTVANGHTLRDIALDADQPQVVAWLDAHLSPAQIQIVLAAIPAMLLAFTRASAR